MATGRRRRQRASLSYRTQRIVEKLADNPAHVDLDTLIPLEDVTELPEEIRQAHGLESLSLGSKLIVDLPSWLADLPRLRQIDAANASLATLPDLPNVRWALSADTVSRCREYIDLSQVYGMSIHPTTSSRVIFDVCDLARRGSLDLSELRIHNTIDIGDNREQALRRWPRFDLLDSRLNELLEHQLRLQMVALSGFPIGRVPETLSLLSQLSTLNLAGMWPRVLPDWLFELPSLTELDLSENGMSDLPAALGNARRLSHLELAGNRFTRVPASVWELAVLEYLGLQNCPLEEIQSSILRLERLRVLKLGDRFATGNRVKDQLPADLISPPPEVAIQGLSAIRNYWRQEKEAGVDYLAEAKLLIVGEPGAGKTSLAKKILDPNYVLDSAEASTEGIAVSSWGFDSAIRVQHDGGERLLRRDFRVNIWDFGGQEIYHATHQFFLTKRSVYVLVTDERKEDTDFEYWLEIVNLLSDGSPVIIVQNRKQGRYNRVDLGGLRQRYPNLVGAVTLDLADNGGLHDAVRIIRRELEQLPHIGSSLPKTWRDVRIALEADARDYISAEQFFDICSTHGFTRREDMQQLGSYLHDLGICLFFQDDELLSRTVVLKPEWGTGAVYRVLDDPSIARRLGIFDLSDLRRIWHEPAYEPMRAELLQLMVKFGLCYPVPGSNTFAAPQLLAPSRPAYTWEPTGNLELRYEYDVMPKGIVQRLIVALHDLIPPGETVWRNGVYLEYDASLAEVIENYRRRRLSIRVRGGDPRVLLGVIGHALLVIQRSYPRIKFERYRPCDCASCASSPDPTLFAISELEDFARTGDRIQCRVSRELRSPVALLRGTFPEVEPMPAEAQVDGRSVARAQREVFISYKWGGKTAALADEIENRLAGRGVLITRDKSEVRYRDSIEQFMRRLGAGKCVIVILDRDYLESRNCMFELTRIAGRPEFASRVYPIVLSDAEIFETITRIGYVRHWEKKRDELNEAMREVGQENLQGIREELDLYAHIRNTIAGIMNVLADMNTLTPEMHRDADFEQLFHALESALS